MALTFERAYDPGKALGLGFEALKKAPAPILLGGLLVQCGQGTGSTLGDLTGQSDSPAWTGDWAGALERIDSYGDGSLVLAILLATLCVGAGLLLVFFYQAWIQSGFIRLHREVLSSGRGRLSTLLASIDAFWPMLRWKILKSFVMLGTGTVSAAPGGLLVLLGYAGDSTATTLLGLLLLLALALPVTLYVALGLYFGPWLVVLDGLRARVALERSWEMARGRRVHLLVFILVMSLFSLLGMLLFCVGVVLTRGLAETGSSAAFLLFTRGQAELDGYSCLRDAAAGTAGT